MSLHRSGTKSLSGLLNDSLGLRTIHWPDRHAGESLQAKVAGRETDFDYVLDVITPKIASYDAASDVPIPTLYQSLYRRYPNAKFILLQRNPADWVRSVRKSIGDRDFRPYERTQYWHYFPDRPARVSDLDDEALTTMYLRHTKDVRGFFDEHAPDQLAVFDLLDPDCGSKVAKFLGYAGEFKLPHATEERRKPMTRTRLARKRIIRWLNDRLFGRGKRH